jgi:hypothetical protein
LGEEDDRLATFLKGFGVGEIPHKNRTEKGVLTLTDAQTKRIRSLYADDIRLIERVRAAKNVG